MGRTTIDVPIRTEVYGGVPVPVYRRHWLAGPRVPYRKTYRLKPGDRWIEAPTTDRQWEHHVVVGGEQRPVGAVIAQELMEQGAACAYFTEVWGAVVLVTPALICAEPAPPVSAFLQRMKQAQGGTLAGLPDVVAQFCDGRFVFREAKNIRAKDKLRSSQHNFARTARQLCGDHVEFGIVEWGEAAIPALREFTGL